MLDAMVRCILLLMLACMGAFGLEPEEVAVVYNGDSLLSRSAAERYRTARGIPLNNCLPLHGLGAGADISRETFNQKVRLPLLWQGRALGLMWPSGPRNGRQLIRAMVLMPDLPLRVGGAPGQPGETAAGLDSELMLLGADYPLSGPGHNPLLGQPAPRGREEQKVMGVCRIDAPDEETVYRMILEPSRVEKEGLWGWVVVDEGGPYPEGDKIFRAVADMAKARFQPLFYDTSKETLADSFPLMPQTAVYFGWYAERANGPFHPSAPKGFRFAPGAVAFHLHSFSAVSVKDPARWVGALLQRGAVATAGNVAEPYLSGCINYSILYQRLLAGDTLAEASLSATPFVSWMGIVLGDPLYRPFPPKIKRLPLQNPFYQWQQLCSAAKGSLRKMQAETEARMQGKQGALFAEMFGWHCAESGEMKLAVQYFQFASNRYASLADRTRTSLLSITSQALSGDRHGAVLSARQLLNSSVGSPYRPAIARTADAVMSPKK